MKRSDMLQQLIETKGAYDSWKEQCEYMLKIMEDAGMKPPPIPTKASGWEVGKGESSYKNEWEPEANCACGANKSCVCLTPSLPTSQG